MAFMATPLFTTALTGTVTVGGALSGLSTVLGLAGSFSQASAAQDAAKANARYQRQAAAANASEMERQAVQEEAAGQHKALQDRRKAALMLSRAQAVAAASGGGPLDESLMSGILEEGERQAGYTMYGAEERAGALRHQGEVGQYQAKAQGDLDVWQAKRAAKATMLGAAAKAGGDLFSRFAPSGLAEAADAKNYQVGTKGYSGNYMEYDA